MMERNFSSDYLLTFTALSGSYSLPPPQLPQSPLLTLIEKIEGAAFPQGFGGVGGALLPRHSIGARVHLNKNV